MTILPQLERDLYKAAEDRLPAQGSDPSPPPASARPSLNRQFRASAAKLPVVVSVGVAIAIAAIAIATLEHPHRSTPPNVPGTGSNTARPGRQQLLQTLAVLRAPANAPSRRAIACVKSPPKPPSAAFRACRTSPVFLLMPPFARDPSVLAQQGYPQVETSLIRVVAIPHFKASIALIPAIWEPSPRSRQRADGLEVVLAYAGGATDTGPKPTSVATVRTRGLAVSGGNATPRMRTVFGAVVVPDRVATVTLEPIRLISPPAPVDPHRFGTVTTSVHDNVAAFQFAVPTVTDPHAKSLVYAVTVLARAIWSDHRGQVIARTTTQLPLWLRVQGKGPITATN